MWNRLGDIKVIPAFFNGFPCFCVYQLIGAFMMNTGTYDARSVKLIKISEPLRVGLDREGLYRAQLDRRV